MSSSYCDLFVRETARTKGDVSLGVFPEEKDKGTGRNAWETSWKLRSLVEWRKSSVRLRAGEDKRYDGRLNIQRRPLTFSRDCISLVRGWQTSKRLFHLRKSSAIRSTVPSPFSSVPENFSRFPWTFAYLPSKRRGKTRGTFDKHSSEGAPPPPESGGTESILSFHGEISNASPTIVLWRFPFPSSLLRLSFRNFAALSAKLPVYLRGGKNEPAD